MGLMGAAALLTGFTQPQAALAEEFTADANFVDVIVTLGTADDQFIITPSNIPLNRGTPYKLVLVNASKTTRHVFSAPEFAAVVTGSSVQSGSPLVEVKGVAREIALNPGARATWSLFPPPPGTPNSYTFRCTTHGLNNGPMQGTITVSG